MRRESLDEVAAEMIAELTADYIELAKEVVSLELQEPVLSMEETMAVWVTASSIKKEALEATALDGSMRHVPLIYDQVLATAFGSILTDLEAVRGEPVPELTELVEASTKALEVADSRRVEVFVGFATKIALTSLAISKLTVGLALLCLSSSEQELAGLLAKSLLSSHIDLDGYARHKAEQWIGKTAWSGSKFCTEEEL